MYYNVFFFNYNVLFIVLCITNYSQYFSEHFKNKISITLSRAKWWLVHLMPHFFYYYQDFILLYESLFLLLRYAYFALNIYLLCKYYIFTKKKKSGICQKQFVTFQMLQYLSTYMYPQEKRYDVCMKNNLYLDVESAL